MLDLPAALPVQRVGGVEHRDASGQEPGQVQVLPGHQDDDHVDVRRVGGVEIHALVLVAAHRNRGDQRVGIVHPRAGVGEQFHDPQRA